MQNILNKFEVPNVRALLYIHFAICSIGLLAFIAHIASIVGQTFIWPLNFFISYTDWATLSTTPTKPIELIQYVLSVTGLVFYYAAVLVFIGRFGDFTSDALIKISANRLLIIIYLCLLLLLNIWLVKDHEDLTNILFGFWFLILTLPALPLFNSWLDWLDQKSSLWSIGALTILIASLGFSFYPYVTNKLAISNDYMDIPEQTILSSGVVDNHVYINTHNIGGLQKHDPRVNTVDLPRVGEFIKLTQGEAIKKFVANSPQKFAFDEIHGGLIVKELMKLNEADALAMIASNDQDRDRIYSFYYDQKLNAQVKKTYTPEEIEFIRKNRREFLDQALAGHYFHHHNTLLGTINEYALGKPQNQTVYLYGWLSTVAIAETMAALGGITFETYQSVLYSFYPLYYLLLLAAAGIIFKRLSYVLLVGTISISSLYYIGFETIRYAPGFNPIRHFFDIFALVCFYWYLFAPRKNLIYLAVALTFTLIGMLFSKEFGLVLLLSMLATIMIRSVCEKRKSASEIILMVIVILAALASLLMITTGKNQTLLYVLLGVAAPAMHWLKLLSLLLLFSAVYVFLTKKTKLGDNWRYISVFWFLYTQGLLIYYIWNPAPNHLLSLGTIWGMLFALLLKHWASNSDWGGKYENKALLACNSLLMVFIFIPGIFSYNMEQIEYNKVFKEHKLYRWNFARAQFLSTMDPGVFENAVQLIKKYSTGPSIYILSKYDNILPFLSAKYSAMPFSEMALSLVTMKEMDKSTDLILHNRPEYLFVDTDMKRSHVGDVFGKDDPVSKFAAPVYDASRGRAMVLDNFSKVFKGIEGMYERVETGQLISVYKLRDATLLEPN